MIASFSRRFVFLKTRKTAGTSVELALSSACGPEDIVTPISLEDEHLRVRDGVIGARNFADAEVMESYRTAVLTRNGDLHRAAMQRAKSEGFFNHMPAAKVASRLPPDFWRSAFKFSIVRHPYERAVSSAYFRLLKVGHRRRHGRNRSSAAERKLRRATVRERDAYRPRRQAARPVSGISPLAKLRIAA